MRLSPADLAKRPYARTVEVEDSFYKRRMRYKAVPLRDLMTAAYGGRAPRGITRYRGKMPTSTT